MDGASNKPGITPANTQAIRPKAGQKRPKSPDNPIKNEPGPRSKARKMTQDLQLSKREASVIKTSNSIPKKTPTYGELLDRLDPITENALFKNDYQELKLLIPDINDWNQSEAYCDFFQEMDCRDFDFNAINHKEIQETIKRENETLYRWLYNLSRREEKSPTDPHIKLLSAWNDLYSIKYREDEKADVHDNYFHWRDLEHPDTELIQTHWEDDYFESEPEPETVSKPEPLTKIKKRTKKKPAVISERTESAARHSKRDIEKAQRDSLNPSILANFLKEEVVTLSGSVARQSSKKYREMSDMLNYTLNIYDDRNKKSIDDLDTQKAANKRQKEMIRRLQTEIQQLKEKDDPKQDHKK